MLGNMACFFLFVYAEFFGVSDSLDPDQAQSHVGSDLGPKQFAKVISRQHQKTKSAYWVLLLAFLSSAEFFSKINLFQKNHTGKIYCFSCLLLACLFDLILMSHQQSFS